MGTLRTLHREKWMDEALEVQKQFSRYLSQEMGFDNRFGVWIAGKRSLQVSIIRVRPLDMLEPLKDHVTRLAAEASSETSITVSVVVDSDLEQWAKEEPEWYNLENAGVVPSEADQKILDAYFAVKATGQSVSAGNLMAEAKIQDKERFAQILTSMTTKDYLSVAADGSVTLEPLGRRLYFCGF